MFKNETIRGFNFVCDTPKELEARGLLQSIYGVHVFPESKPINHVTVVNRRGDVSRLEGTLLGGFCHQGLIAEVETELSQREILASPLRVLEDFDSFGGVRGYRKWLARR